MDNFICWEISERQPKAFSSQDKVILDLILPTIKDTSVNSLIRNYYITKANLTNSRLQVFVNDENLDKLENKVESRFAEYIVVRKDGPRKAVVVYPHYGPKRFESKFRDLLQEVTTIAVELLSWNAIESKKIALKARFETKPFGATEPRTFLDVCLREHSPTYNHLVWKQTVDDFWINFNRFSPKMGSRYTPWMHFFYNAVLGYDWPRSIGIENATKHLERMGLRLD